MSKKQFAVICVLLLIIICLQIYTISQNTQLAANVLNGDSFLAGRLDDLNGRVLAIRDAIDASMP